MKQYKQLNKLWEEKEIMIYAAAPRLYFASKS